MPEMSIIILNWNGKHHLETCLTSLRRQSFRDFETIFVDNASQDGSVEFVRSRFPETLILPLAKNVGFAAGNNAGFEIARGEWIVLLNNDTEADGDWLESLHEAGHRYPFAGTLACMMCYFDERHRIENCGFDMTAGGATIALGRGEGVGPDWSCEREVFGGCGGAVAYRRSMIEKIGLFDPDFFMIYEDLDLSFRAQLQGYKTVLVPQAVVYHKYRSSIKEHSANAVYFSQRNIEFAYAKNTPGRLIFCHLPYRILYELGAAIYFVRLGLGRPFFKAKLDVLRQFPTLLSKRREIQTRRTLSGAQLKPLFRRDQLGAKWNKFWAGWKKAAIERVSV
jgi:hypothetical protein